MKRTLRNIWCGMMSVFTDSRFFIGFTVSMVVSTMGGQIMRMHRENEKLKQAAIELAAEINRDRAKEQGK